MPTRADRFLIVATAERLMASRVVTSGMTASSIMAPDAATSKPSHAESKHP